MDSSPHPDAGRGNTFGQTHPGDDVEEEKERLPDSPVGSSGPSPRRRSTTVTERPSNYRYPIDPIDTDRRNPTRRATVTAQEANYNQEVEMAPMPRPVSQASDAFPPLPGDGMGQHPHHQQLQHHPPPRIIEPEDPCMATAILVAGFFIFPVWFVTADCHIHCSM